MTGSTLNRYADTIMELHKLGRKLYEFTGHLGNTLAITLDKKKGFGNDGGYYVGYYPELLALNDYYPFGMLMPDRYPAAGNGYRFGYNTQEKVNEIAGIGNWYTAKYWEYCSRTGTRKNPDPIRNPSLSPYAVFDGNPILKSDEEGNTPTAVIGLFVGVVEAGIDLGSQVVGNMAKGKSIGQAFKEVDYADVGLSFAQGFVDGTTLGASKFSGLSDAAFGTLRAGVDWKPMTENPDDRFNMVGGEWLFGDEKYNKGLNQFGKDLAIEAIGIGMGKVFDGALGIGKQGKGLYKQRYLDQTIGRGILGNMFQVPTDVSLDRLMDNNMQTIILPEVIINSSGQYGSTSDEEIQRAGQEMRNNMQKALGE
jgi:hypothetical protein